MTEPRAEIVLDTNVVLDRWVFDDPVSRPLAVALSRGTVRWIATASMLYELDGVLRRPLAARWEAAREHALTCDFRLWADVVEAPPPLATPGMRCTDADDQKFADLAVHRRVRWLLTHDRALLKLARAARSHGVAITTPAAWRP